VIAPSGRITFNEPAIRLFGETIPDFVQILYNPDTATVALIPAQKDDPYSYRLRPAGPRNDRVLAAKQFLQEIFSLPISRVNVPVFAIDGAIAFKLAEPEEQHQEEEEEPEEYVYGEPLKVPAQARRRRTR